MSEIIFKEDAIEWLLSQTACRTKEELEKEVKKDGVYDDFLFGVLSSINTVEGLKPVLHFGDERLEPKKPRVHRIHFSYKPDEIIVQCPNCKRRLKSQLTVTNPYAYCPRCGQAIDWSEEKE